MQQRTISMNRLIHPVVHWGMLLLLCSPMYANTSHNLFNPLPPDNPAIKERLLSKAGVVDLRYDGLVQDYIESFTVRARPRARRILSRAQVFFPIVEKYLADQGMPRELKYLTVIESAVNPNAISDAGAVGLWQLMPNTARHYGLQVTNEIDERKDVHKATQAALKYLAHLKEKLGNWTLAIAAYNCGGGKVLEAKRYSYSEDFWELRMFLPKQTQYYIHKMAAAVYVLNYHELHDLVPSKAGYYLRFTKTTKVYNEISFDQISQALDIPVDVLERLNPSYRQQVLPDNKNGNYLIVPKVKMDRFINYYNSMIAITPDEYIRA